MTPDEARRALTLVADEAVMTAATILGGGAHPDDLLDAIPAVVAYYSDGTAALAADFYDESREAAGARGRFRAEPVVEDRSEKIRRGVLWVVKAFGEDVDANPRDRLAEVVQLEVARPHRDTIVQNRRRDPEAAGWKRIARGDGCKFCRMLAAKGTVYTRETARFASHPNCNCTAQPWFKGQPIAEPASALQYLASGRKRTPEQRERLRDYLNAEFPDAPG